jgi:ATP-dependent Clp protease ATP-binding subunit ClpA
MFDLAPKMYLRCTNNTVKCSGRVMFERFTDRARRVLVYAQEEARDLDHAFLGTEHILLGLIREGDGVAAKALDGLGITYDVVREKVKVLTELAIKDSPHSQPFTPRAKKVLEMSLREAVQLGHSYIGTEHLLLGIVRQGDGAAVRILNNLGVEMSGIQTQVVQLMSSLSNREVGEPSVHVIYDGAIFRGVVRALGEQLRPDLDAADLDDLADTIADDLFNQLRQSWAEAGNSF